MNLQLIINKDRYLAVSGNIKDEDNIKFTVTNLSNNKNEMYAAVVTRYKEVVKNHLIKVEDNIFVMENIPSGTMMKIKLCFVADNGFISTNNVAIAIGEQTETSAYMPEYSPTLALLKYAFCSVENNNNEIIFKNAAGEQVGSVTIDVSDNKALEAETNARIDADTKLRASISQINTALDTKLEYKGRLSGVDLATITERGIYYVNFDCTNLPDSFADYFPNSSAFLLVLPYGTDDEGKGISLTQVIFGLTTTMEGPGGNLITPYPYDTADMYACNIYYHEAYGAAIDQPWTKINDFKKYFEKYLHNEYVNKTDLYTAQYDNGDGSYEIGSSYTFQDIVNAIDSLGSYAKKSDVDEQIGNMETALDKIIAIQNTLIGGKE